MEKHILESPVYKDTKSVQLMDQFENGDITNNTMYDSLKLNRAFSIRYRGMYYYVSLYIERMPFGSKVLSSEITFTAFKKEIVNRTINETEREKHAVLTQVFKGVEELYSSINNNKSIEYSFPVPVKFNAQNSKNRSGYGNIYHGDDLIVEGTYYGETTDYIIVSAEYTKWW